MSTTATSSGPSFLRRTAPSTRPAVGLQTAPRLRRQREHPGLPYSTDLGDTWQSTIVRNVRGAEGEKVENNRPVGNIAVDSKSGSDDIVYVTWQDSTPFVTAPNANPTRAMVAVSTNGGRDFGEPVNIAAPAWETRPTPEGATSRRRHHLARAPPPPTSPARGSAAAPYRRHLFFFFFFFLGAGTPSRWTTRATPTPVFTPANIAPARCRDWVSKSTATSDWTAYMRAMSPYTGCVGARLSDTAGPTHRQLVSQVNPLPRGEPSGVSSVSEWPTIVHRRWPAPGREPNIPATDEPQGHFVSVSDDHRGPNGRLACLLYTRSDPDRGTTCTTVLRRRGKTFQEHRSPTSDCRSSCLAQQLRHELAPGHRSTIYAISDGTTPAQRPDLPANAGPALRPTSSSRRTVRSSSRHPNGGEDARPRSSACARGLIPLWGLTSGTVPHRRRETVTGNEPAASIDGRAKR